MATTNLLEIPMYSNKKTLNEMYKKSKQRQQQAIQATALGLMINQIKKKKTRPAGLPTRRDVERVATIQHEL